MYSHDVFCTKELHAFEALHAERRTRNWSLFFACSPLCSYFSEFLHITDQITSYPIWPLIVICTFWNWIVCVIMHAYKYFKSSIVSLCVGIIISQLWFQIRSYLQPSFQTYCPSYQGYNATYDIYWGMSLGRYGFLRTRGSFPRNRFSGKVFDDLPFICQI